MQESFIELMRAQESLGEPRNAQASPYPDESKRALSLQQFADRCYDQVFADTDRNSLCNKNNHHNDTERPQGIHREKPKCSRRGSLQPAHKI